MSFRQQHSKLGKSTMSDVHGVTEKEKMRDHEETAQDVAKSC